MGSPADGSRASPDAPTSPEDVVPEPPARVVANSAWSILGQGGAALIGSGVGIYAVRHFTTSSWGHYATALALVTLFTVVSGAGLGPLALRELTSAPDRQDEIIGLNVQALGWTFFLAAFALLAITPALGYPHEVLVLIVVLLPLLALNPALAVLTAAFNARSSLQYVAWFQLVQAAAYGLLAVAVVAGSVGVTGLAVATTVGAMLATALGVSLLRSRLAVRIRLGRPRRRAWSLLRAAIPFGAINIVGIVYDRVDTLMLSVLSSATSVAHYAVPYGFLRLAWILPSVVSAAFFPLLSRGLSWASADAEYLFFLVVRALVFISVPAALLLTLASPDILPFVFGHRYDASVPTLQIMAWTLAFSFPSYVLWYGIVVVRQERRAFLVALAALVVNVVVNGFAIPRYGPRGAAAALLVSELAVMLGYALVVHRKLYRVPVARLLAKPIGTAIVVIPLAALLATRSALAAGLGGAAAYALVLLALGYVSLAEWQPVAAVLLGPLTRLRRAG